MKLRPYQSELEFNIVDAWIRGARNVAAVAPMGSGKTVLFCDIILHHTGASVAIAHRQELVSQMSLTLARNKIRHRIIGAKELIKTCVQLHMLEVGYSYFDPSAACAVCGVDTLVRMDPRHPFFAQVTLGVVDEAHHVLRSNKWGKAVQMFPNAKWLGVTATPMRADGKGIGRHADGVFDAMVVAPGMRDLIRMGYLTDYRLFEPASDLDLSAVPTSAGGDYSPDPLRKAVHRSHIVGDLVKHYLTIAAGKLGVTFAVDVESAKNITAAYLQQGVPAALVTADTPDLQRVRILRAFRKRELLQLVNVDLFGEGFDLPAIEVVSMGRPTQSFSLFSQQWGRAGRVMVDESLEDRWDEFSDDERRAHIAASTKQYSIIIDHVSNRKRHGLPDAKRRYTMDRRESGSRSKSAVIPSRTCTECAASYDRTELVCPYCGTEPDIVTRTTPHQVDGDLIELSPEALAILRGEVDKPLDIWAGAPPEVVRGMTGHWHRRNEAQSELRAAMSQWCGYRTQQTDFAHPEVRKAMKEFFFTFGIDVVSAQALARKEATELTEVIRRSL